jgi:hypothetical protein
VCSSDLHAVSHSKSVIKRKRANCKALGANADERHLWASADPQPTADVREGVAWCEKLLAGDERRRRYENSNRARRACVSGTFERSEVRLVKYVCTF